MKSHLYDAAAFVAETRFAGVLGIVHVEAAAVQDSPRVESEFVRASAKAERLPCVLVSRAALAEASTPQVLAALAEEADIVGVRDFGVVNYLDNPSRLHEFDAGLASLAREGLLLDLDCDYQHMGPARRMAERHPDLRIVLEHIGFPISRDDAYYTGWAAAVRELACAANVSCKLSGLGMTDLRWNVESLRRWVETCLDAFGPERCLFGSNWPVDRLASSYDALVAGVLELLEPCSRDERDAVLYANAERCYFTPRRAPS